MQKRASGRWNSNQAKRHINTLEIWAVSQSLQAFSSMITGQSVLLRTDSATVVAYLQNEGDEVRITESRRDPQPGMVYHQ